MGNALILVIEDERDIRELISFNLSRDGYTVEAVDTAEKGLDSIKRTLPDMVLLDMMLPGMDGFELLRLIRKNKETARLPVIMVTARTDDSDIVAGLELGADDYICKPFSPRVLVARVRTRLRETSWKSDQGRDADEREKTVHSSNGIELNAEKHEVSVHGNPVSLSPTEFSFLEFFMSNPGRVFSRQRLIDAVHGEDYSVTDRSVDVQILALRKKICDAGECIETVRGIGYRYREGASS